jgi:hypothetical protein
MEQNRQHISNSKKEETRKSNPWGDKSFFLFSPTHPFRRVLIQITSHWSFNAMILVAILLNALVSGMEDFTWFNPNNGDVVICRPKVYDKEELSYNSSLINEISSPSNEKCYALQKVTTAEEFELCECSFRNKLVVDADPIFLYLFTVECSFKLIAMGLYLGPDTYLADTWNWIDFTVVVAGWLEMVPGIPSVAFLRTVRVLRPLRTLTRVASMRTLIQGVISAIPALVNVMAMFLFCFSLFGILAVEMWGSNGILYHRCRTTPYPVKTMSWKPAQISWPAMVNVTGWNEYSGAHHPNPGPPLPQSLLPLQLPAAATGTGTGAGAGAGAGLMGSAAAKAAAEAVAAAAAHQDLAEKMKNAMHTDLRCVATETAKPLPGQTWDIGLYESPWQQEHLDCDWPIADVEDVSHLCSPPGRYGLGTCPAGSHCGSDFDEFGNSRFTTARAKNQRSSVYQEDFDWGFNHFPNFFEACITIFQCITLEGWSPIMYRVMDAYDPVLAVSYFVILILFGAFCVVNLVLSVLWDSFVNNQRDKIEGIYTDLFNQLDNEDGSSEGYFPAHRVFRVKAYMQAVAEKRLVLALRHMSGDQTSPSNHILELSLTRTEFVMISKELLGEHRKDGLALIPKERGVLKSGKNGSRGFVTKAARLRAMSMNQRYGSRNSSDDNDSGPNGNGNGNGDGDGDGDGSNQDQNQNQNQQRQSCCDKCLAFVLVPALGPVIDNPWFERIVLAVIIFNSSILALDSYPEVGSMQVFMEYSGFVCTVFFMVELVFKVFGMGLGEYFGNGFNQFDSIIVAASIIELMYDPPDFLVKPSLDGGAATGSLSVLRTFRLLRVLKLARGLPQLQNTLVIMLSLLPAVVNFSLLLFLFMYIFALLGVQFYSNRFHFDEFGRPVGIGEPGYWSAEVPRENFDTVVDGIMRVFQILTGEDWNQLMFMCR